MELFLIFIALFLSSFSTKPVLWFSECRVFSMHRNGWTMRCGNRAKKQICVVFRLSLSHDLPPTTSATGNWIFWQQPLVLLPFCPQRTFSVSCTWWFILDVRFPRLSKISRYSRADQRDHPADASTASFSQILWSRGICRLGMPRQCGRAFILWWFSASLQHLQLLTNVIMVWWHTYVELCQRWMKINQKQRSRVEKYQSKWN